MSDPSPEIQVALRIPGTWGHPKELIERLPDGCRCTGEALICSSGEIPAVLYISEFPYSTGATFWETNVDYLVYASGEEPAHQRNADNLGKGVSDLEMSFEQ